MTRAMPDRFHRVLTHPRAGAVIALAALLGSLLLLLVPMDRLSDWTSEEGFFEQASWIGYLVAGAACLLMLRRCAALYVPAALVLFAMCARELDMHSRFTTDSMLKSRYYLKVKAPLMEKLLAGTVVLALAAVVIYLLMRYLPLLRRRLRERAPEAVSLGAAGIVLVCTKLVDRLPGILKHDYGIGLSELARHLAMALEEPMELMIPLLVLLALLQVRLTRRG